MFLKQLRFFNRKAKDIIISESAVTEVLGTILTLAFLGFFVQGETFNNLIESYEALFTAETGIALFKEMFFGIVLGFCFFQIYLQ